MSNPAAIASLALGLVLCALYAWVGFLPAKALPALRAFPRKVRIGQILTGICLIWFAWNLGKVDLGPFNPLKNLLYVAAPLGIYYVLVYTPDLLAVRGVCVLVLLAGQPLLIATRWTGTPASWAVGILVYAMLIKAMVLVVYPHLWIRSLNRMEKEPKLLRSGLILGGVIGVAMIIAGAVSFS